MSPARVQVIQRGRSLRVVFSRIGQEPEVMIAANGEVAWRHAVSLIAAREELQHGDRLAIDEEEVRR